MAWKGVHLTKPARLSLADKQIVVVQDEGEVRLALEDVAWIVIDCPQVTLTAMLISACAEAGIAIVTCDQRHTPSGLTLPFHGHFKQAGVAQRQLAMSAPLKKRLWQVIVQRKIANQAAALGACGRQGGETLHAMEKLVGSGDPDNVEARAAREYWRSLFKDFSRARGDDLRNKLLNYGYAVARSGVARAIVAHGLVPAFGIHHESEANAFNLADDLFEPFRPFVDAMVYAVMIGRSPQDELTVEDRRVMAGAPLRPALADGGTVTLLAAAELAAESLVRAIEAADPGLLVLPGFGDFAESAAIPAPRERESKAKRRRERARQAELPGLGDEA